MPGQFEIDKLTQAVAELRSGDVEAANRTLEHMLRESDDPERVAAVIQREIGKSA